jgi:ABC-type antimicrobial peptide transport system permease subunit
LLPNDALVYLTIAILLGAMTLAAGFIPAMRASRIDPMTALREE